MLTTERTIDSERRALGDVEMLGEARWGEAHRRAAAGVSLRAMAREPDLDRKTAPPCLRHAAPIIPPPFFLRPSATASPARA